MFPSISNITANTLASSILLNLLYTVITIVFLIICYWVTFFLFKNKSKTTNLSIVKSRIKYLYFFIFIILIIKIWGGGVEHLLTMLSLIAAGLVVSNKETIMNLVGFFIINWRSLFSKGDFIQLQNYAGKVKAVGPIYFRLFEALPDSENQLTGKIINIPNGLIINNSVINHSDGSVYIRYPIEVPWQPETINNKFLEQLEADLATIVNDINQDDPRYLKITKDDHSHDAAKPIMIELFFKDNPSIVYLNISFLSKPKNKSTTQRQLLNTILKAKNLNETR